MRHLFIINPAAGKKESTVKLEQQLKKLTFDHEVVYTKGESDAQRIVEEAAQSNEPIRIYACGGDGTLNEVVNGAAGHDHVAITCVPKGTGNDFLKIFGEHYRELFYDLEALAQGPQTPFDLIDCNGKLGIDVVCAGADARIAADVHRYKNWKFVSGMGAYCLALAENVLLKGLNRPMNIHMGDIDHKGKTALVCVCNGRHYGGGFNPAPEARIADGELELLLVKKITRARVPGVILKYKEGRYKELPDLITCLHPKEVRIRALDGGMTVNFDGETRVVPEITFRLSDRRIPLILPKGVRP